ncbi:MAG: hypothetical protein N2506_00915, partial [Dehalococcoidales bacterium]|nr:hypothetical protein [Dehalococcoidales bacterium]
PWVFAPGPGLRRSGYRLALKLKEIEGEIGFRVMEPDGLLGYLIEKRPIVRVFFLKEPAPRSARAT